jgi:sec-independent protein translocase protein TatA
MRNFLDNPLLLIILLLLVVVIFGSKRLPDAARSVGRSMKIFKAEVKDLRSDDDRPTGQPSTPLEGRVVDDRTSGGASGTRPADEPHGTDEQRRGA